MAQRGRIWLGMALLVMTIGGCDSANDQEAAPPVIPAEAFAIDTGLFTQGAGAKASVGANYLAAVVRVVPVSAIIGANLIIPSAVTARALAVHPVLDGATWTWDSETTAGGQTVAFSLSATIDAPDILWSMKVSYDNGQTSLEDFELYTAVTSLDGKSGTWRLYYQIDGASREVLDAEYAVSSAPDAVVTYSIPTSALEHAGDSVRYERDGDGRSFEWNQVAETLNHLVVWNAVTHSGSITATNYNGGDEACWDENLDDAACSG